MYQIVICDDEQRILNDISNKIKNEFNKLQIPNESIVMSDSRQLMEYLENNHVDILFLDIDMPYFSGMDIAGFINKNKLNTMIVFVTSHDSLVYQTFEYRPFGFIRKSYIDEELEALVKRIANELNDRKQELTVTKGQDITRIPINEIIYIESFGNYLNIKTEKEEIKIRETMTAIEQELKYKGFIRSHKGYLVNSNYITKLGNGQLELVNNEETFAIPVGRSYEKNVKRSLLEFLRN
ncbi:MAG: response regulator transcription factor [Lachnospiraceae bacterium]|nr:response regulator transcription factor [Lachnospiraceae bacterium]